MNKKKLLFIDRDGTIIVEPQPSQQVDSFEKLEFLPGVIGALKKLADSGEFELVMVTNQDGLGTDSFPEPTFWPVHNLMLSILSNEGVEFSKVHIDRSFPQENKPSRKPGTALLTEYFSDEYNLAESYVIGDRETDVELANNLGCQAVFIGDDSSKPCSLISPNWEEIADFLLLPLRSTELSRQTKETQISLKLVLDQQGRADIETGLNFFDHMLDQLARHSGCSIYLRTRGDLQVDEHHTIEDTALALGEAFRQVLFDKRGMERYGFALVMDEALAQVALDFGGRPWLVWEADYKRERVGDMPTEMFHHFFKSFSDAARCNLYIRCEGANEHHKIEATFKGLAKAIKMAIQRNTETIDQLPSTKGLL